MHFVRFNNIISIILQHGNIVNVWVKQQLSPSDIIVNKQIFSNGQKMKCLNNLVFPVCLSAQFPPSVYIAILPCISVTKYRLGKYQVIVNKHKGGGKRSFVLCSSI